MARKEDRFRVKSRSRMRPMKFASKVKQPFLGYKVLHHQHRMGADRGREDRDPAHNDSTAERATGRTSEYQEYATI